MASRRSTTLFTLPLAALLGLCGCAQNLREAAHGRAGRGERHTPCRRST